MSHKGMNGAMGPTEIEHPIVAKLRGLWNELGILDGYIYSYQDNMPEHLRKLSEAIRDVAEHLKENPVKVALQEPPKCQSCKRNPISEEHNCPYESDIHDDNKTCRCCDDCTHECAMDI